MSSRRALHFVFKVANRRNTIDFYRRVLGMKVLRHEEFEEGCKAACNGPYDGKWSKSMIGYGDEDNHFVVELTYNYGIKEYKVGNDFQGISIFSNDVFANAKKEAKVDAEEDASKFVLTSPGGQKFNIYNNKGKSDPVQRVSLGVSNLETSIGYWNGLLGMDVVEKGENSAVLTYSPDQCHLELVDIKGPVEHGTAFGRIAFSCPREQLPGIQDQIKKAGQTILTPLVSLDTPGKATVEVVILADPDGHEICFVGDEAFRELSKVDPESDSAITKAIAEDKSDEWFEKQLKKKEKKN